MTEIRIGVRVSFRGRAMRVVEATAMSAEARRTLLEDDETGERFVITTRVRGPRAPAGTPGPGSREPS